MTSLKVATCDSRSHYADFRVLNLDKSGQILNSITYLFVDEKEHMTQFKIEVMSHCKRVSKILTALRIQHFFFSFYHQLAEICSFPTMYNTWGCSLGQNG